LLHFLGCSAEYKIIKRNRSSLSYGRFF